MFLKSESKSLHLWKFLSHLVFTIEIYYDVFSVLFIMSFCLGSNAFFHCNLPDKVHLPFSAANKVNGNKTPISHEEHATSRGEEIY